MPFDYIFILEGYENGVLMELGTYYSFRDIVIARNERFGERSEASENSDKEDKLIFSVKVGKSYKNRGWAIIRDSTYDLIPKLPYEDECNIVVDGIPTTAKLNLLPRIFYDKTDEVVKHLKYLANINPDDRIEVQLLLDKENHNYGAIGSENLNKYLINLKKENEELKTSISELKEILNYMDEENKNLLVKHEKLNILLKDFENVGIDDKELSLISNPALKMKISDIVGKIDNFKKNLDNY